MVHTYQIELQRLGLSAIEAQIYLALLSKSGNWRATALVAMMHIPRSTVYLALNALVNKGLVEAEAGYGGRFSAVPPERALRSLIAAEREALLLRQQELAGQELVAAELTRELMSVATPLVIDPDAEVIQVLRDPRVVAGRFEQLQEEAKHQVDVFIKAPIIITDHRNPAQEKAMRRGVRYRGLYERAILDIPQIEPLLMRWISAGEQARLHDGELPHKLAIFDKQNILMPLVAPNGNSRTLFIRHPHLATSLGLLFDFLWERSKPIPGDGKKRRTRLTKGATRKASERDKARANPAPAIGRRPIQQEQQQLG
jgi:HTH-type transcriptional regulator, sugar sensing transcriptional regulator